MVNVKAINDERLDSWKEILVKQHATPVLLVAIGHDHKSGELQLLITKDMTQEHIKLFLEYALKQLHDKKTK